MRYAYLIPSGIADNTSLFVRAMSYGNNNTTTPIQPNTALPTCPHQMIRINNNTAVYAAWNNAFWEKYEPLAGTAGFSATFLYPSYTGWVIKEAWNYQLWGDYGPSGASGFRNKLQEQPDGTLLVLTCHDDCYSNHYIYTGELVQNWGASSITGVKFRDAYVLVSLKNQKLLHEELGSPSGTGGFCGWIKVGDYNTGLWVEEYSGYFAETEAGTGYAAEQIDAAYPSNSTVQGVGFFKSQKSGDYTFTLGSDDASYLWIGEHALGEFTTGNAVIKIDGLGGLKTGIYTTGLRANTYYPIKMLYGNAAYNGECRLSGKYHGETYSANLNFYHSNYSKSDTNTNYHLYYRDLFEYSCKALYGLKDLHGTGRIIATIRRSDNTETGITAQDISDGTALTWVGTGPNDTGFIHTLYDQGTVGHHVGQATAASQPAFITGGAYVTDSLGNYAIKFDGVNDYLTGDTLAGEFDGLDQPISMFLIADMIADSANRAILSFATNVTAPPLFYVAKSSADYHEVALFPDAGSPSWLPASGTWNGTSMLFIQDTGESQKFYINKEIVSDATQNMGTKSYTQFTIGCVRRATNSYYSNGKFTFGAFYSSSMNHLRDVIEDYISGGHGF